MISMYTKQEIILKSHREGKSQRTISQELGISRKTVRKYLAGFEAGLRGDPSETVLGDHLALAPRYDASKRSRTKLTPEAMEKIDSLLGENQKKRQEGLRKQLLKNRDIHERLQAQGIDVGYTTVCNYISAQNGKGRTREAFIRQEYGPGSVCEFDWGEIQLEIDGASGRYYLAVFTSAHSNYRFALVFNRQDTLAFLEAHTAFFSHTGAVYHEMVYDNMRVAVARFTGKGKEPTVALLQLRGHYGFTHRFTNIRRGNEKGHVERSVEVVRRKSFGTRHRFGSLGEARDWLAASLERTNGTRQQLTGRTASELFALEREAMPVAPVGMECAELVQLRADKYATVSYKTNRYSVPDHLVGAFVTVKVKTDSLQMFEGPGRVAVHARSYGKHRWTIKIDHYLETFKRKPGALAGSVALASSGYLRELFGAHFTDSPREFIHLLEYCRRNGVTDGRLGEVVDRLHRSGAREMTAERIEALLGNKAGERAPLPATQTVQMAKSQLGQVSALFN